MGSTNSVDEMPVHEVCLSDFFMGKYEITVGQFKQFIDETGYKTEAEKFSFGMITVADTSLLVKMETGNMTSLGL